MRPDIHPPIDDITLETLMYALGDRTRLCIIGNLDRAKGKPLFCAEATAGITDLSPSTRSYHFRILREGGLITSERNGKECHNTLRLSELDKKFPGLMKIILRLIAAQ